MQLYTPDTTTLLANLDTFLTGNSIADDIWIGIRSYLKLVNGFSHLSYETELHQSFRYLKSDGTVNYFDAPINDTTNWKVGYPLGLSTKDGKRSRYDDLCVAYSAATGMFYNDACNRRKPFICQNNGNPYQCDPLSRESTSSIRSQNPLFGSTICSGGKQCTNLPGNYNCNCPTGSTEVGNSCVPTDPCSTFPCGPPSQVCYFLNINISPNYICASDQEPCKNNPCSILDNTECIADATSGQYSAPHSGRSYNCICKFGFQMDMTKFSTFYYGTPSETDYNYCIRTEECGLYDHPEGSSKLGLSKDAKLWPKHICDSDDLCSQPETGGYKCGCPAGTTESPATAPTLNIDTSHHATAAGYMIDGTMKTYWYPKGMDVKALSSDIAVIRAWTDENAPIFGIRLAISQYDVPEAYANENRVGSDNANCIYEGLMVELCDWNGTQQIGWSYDSVGDTRANLQNCYECQPLCGLQRMVDQNDTFPHVTGSKGGPVSGQGVLHFS